MKREVKFRVWDGKAMYSNPAWMVEVSDGTVWLNTGSHGVDALESREVELMQFTGLKDKNGTDVYEGDIVRCTIEDEPYANLDIVEFKDGAFAFRYRTVTTIRDWINRIPGHEIEVIGNRVENPELLEQPLTTAKDA